MCNGTAVSDKYQFKNENRIEFWPQHCKSNRKVGLENHDDPTPTGKMDIHKRPSFKSIQYATLAHSGRRLSVLECMKSI